MREEFSPTTHPISKALAAGLAAARALVAIRRNSIPECSQDDLAQALNDVETIKAAVAWWPDLAVAGAPPQSAFPRERTRNTVFGQDDDGKPVLNNEPVSPRPILTLAAGKLHFGYWILQVVTDDFGTATHAYCLPPSAYGNRYVFFAIFDMDL